MDGLRFALHKQYGEFTKRHPEFLSNGGTISFFAHSLGSVMVYDLLHETCEVEGIKHEDPPECILGPQPTSSSFGSIPGSRSAGLESGRPKAVEMTGVSGVRFNAALQSPESSVPMDTNSPTETGLQSRLLFLAMILFLVLL